MSKLHGRENDTVVVEETEVKSEVAKREEAIQQFWEEADIFNKSLTKPAGSAPQGDYVFYDGPPFATGTMHYGHILAGTIKDAIPRFWTMRGYRVQRKWGWDCHGLPLENLIEKKLGLANKREIEAFGIKNFNETARESVLEFADDWKRAVPRLGRWADMENDYKTMDSTYTESVWWVFKQLFAKGLVYEGFKSMHLCPRCGTTLSNFEVNLGYKDIKDIAVTIKLPLLDEAGALTNTALLVWTTTPWTLPGNLAAAVHRELTYVQVKVSGEGGASEFFILAKGRLAQLADFDYEIVSEFTGEALLGRSYEPPFNFLKEQLLEGKENAWKIYHADYVELGEQGTGAVHIAPAYGEEDMILAQANNIPIFHHVDYEGRFKPFVSDFAGKLVKPKDDDKSEVSHLDADIEIVRALKDTGRLLKKENITHSYPHCWRDDTPLLNYATTSWFVKVTDLKERLVAANQEVRWVPDHVGVNRFGKWLEGARDWAISRQRYWGAPLPIWKNEKSGEYVVCGSLSELKAQVAKSGNSYLLMRHGEAVSNLEFRIVTDKNSADKLTAKGKEQTLRTAASLKEKNIDLIIHSGYQRTRETAQLMADYLGLNPEQVLADERLGELQAGADLENKTWHDYQALFADEADSFVSSLVGRENRMDVVRRVGHFLYDLENKYQHKTILIVGHASSLFGLRCVAAGASVAEAITLKRKIGFLDNAEVRELPFVPLPHNEDFTLDFHRPYIDEVKLLAADGTELKRVPDVFDCWFESGAMPYGQHHYPFSCDPAVFAKEFFPAQFIAEGLDQTRGWFYSLLVIGVALFDKSPYQNVIVNGLALAEDGKKMSKSLRNYPDPLELVDRVGADAVRFYLLSSPVIRGEDLAFSEKDVLELQRKNIGRLHNVLAMYELCATDTVKASAESPAVLDRWIISRLNQLVEETTAGYENYELDKATRPLSNFIDDLSVWYLRRSRERLKSDVVLDKNYALATLRYVLHNLSLVMAPAMPFCAEYLYRAVRDDSAAESVHLAAWPEGGEIDEAVITEMNLAREIVTLALEARTKAGVKVRQPLATLALNIELEPEYAEIVADEVNVKNVIYTAGQAERVNLDLKITPDLQAEGEAREFIRTVQELRKTAGLLPMDRVELIVSTTPRGESIITARPDLQETILKTVGASRITFDANSGDECVVAGETFRITLKKL